MSYIDKRLGELRTVEDARRWSTVLYCCLHSSLTDRLRTWRDFVTPWTLVMERRLAQIDREASTRLLLEVVRTGEHTERVGAMYLLAYHGTNEALPTLLQFALTEDYRYDALIPMTAISTNESLRLIDEASAAIAGDKATTHTHDAGEEGILQTCVIRQHTNKEQLLALVALRRRICRRGRSYVSMDTGLWGFIVIVARTVLGCSLALCILVILSAILVKLLG